MPPPTLAGVAKLPIDDTVDGFSGADPVSLKAGVTAKLCDFVALSRADTRGYTRSGGSSRDNSTRASAPVRQWSSVSGVSLRCWRVVSKLGRLSPAV